MKYIYLVWIQYAEDAFNIEFDSAFENVSDAQKRMRLVMEQKEKEGYIVDFGETFDPIDDNCRVFVDKIKLNKSRYETNLS